MQTSNNYVYFCFSHQTKTYDAVTEKFMDFSFEKTHSAYMLFYERCDPSKKDLLSETPNIELNQELADWIWHDNIQYLHDKHVFDTTYFNFMWLICSNIPPSLPECKDVMLSNVKLGRYGEWEEKPADIVSREFAMTGRDQQSKTGKA